MEKRRIALYGGTFNPPHIGHSVVLEAVLERGYQVIAMPAGQPPHKALPPGSANAAQRLEMSRLMVRGLENVAVSDFELNHTGASYTADTIEWLVETRPDAKVTLIVGADMLFSFRQWWHFERILKLADVAAVCRASDQLGAVRDAAQSLGASVIEHEPIDISSTKLRDMLSRGEGREWLKPTIWDYIQANKLYIS
ncbi:putative nicotinate-nucleotide adenylyltransferase [Clostridia bacterium]|nr:putative nicotinate-nucleotide adenylyltransferase [Clostridia bacterium]